MGKSPLQFGAYKHYKGGQVKVIGIAHHSETLEEMVVYECQYESLSFGKGSLWVRPLGMFLEEVEVEGKMVKRFEYLGN